MTQPAVAVTPLLEADVAAFSSRAEAWIDARRVRRELAHELALELSTGAREVEQDRVAAEEAAVAAEAKRLEAAEIAARTTTTIVAATTTVAPTTTTVAPPATQPPGEDSTAVSAPTTTVSTTTVPPGPGGPSAAQWEVLRQCESSGNYAIVSANGRYRGAYQFSQATWNWVAGWANVSLIGVDPAAAARADQDTMALALWNRQGWSPWPICGAAAAAA